MKVNTWMATCNDTTVTAVHFLTILSCSCEQIARPSADCVLKTKQSSEASRARVQEKAVNFNEQKHKQKQK